MRTGGRSVDSDSESSTDERVDRVLVEFPGCAAWNHFSRTGAETVTFIRDGDGWAVHGATTGLEDGVAWNVAYRILLDGDGVTRQATVETRHGPTKRETFLEHDGHGSWHVDGEPIPVLRGCIDVDLEASALTNAFPARRLVNTASADSAIVPAAYVRILTPDVERLVQTYRPLSSPSDPVIRMQYEAPAFAFGCVIEYDDSGLVLRYPSIATRIS